MKIVSAGLAALAAVVLALAPSGSAAVTCDATWTSGVSGTWSDTTRWTFSKADDDGVPDADDHVCIEAGGEYTVSITTPNVTAKSVTFGHGTSGTQTLSVESSGFNLSTAGTASTIKATGVLSAKQEVAFAGDLTHHGTISIPTDQSRMLRIGTGAFDLAGGTVSGMGALQLTGGTFKHGNGGSVSGVPVRLHNAAVDLSGSGMAAYTLSGTNSLSADVAALKTVTLRGNGANATLTFGATRTNAGTLILQGATAGHFATLSNGGGQADLVNTGTLQAAAGTGSVSLDTHIDNRGTLDVDESISTGSKRLKSTGTIDIAAAAGFVSFNGTTELDGTGAAITGAGQFSQAGGSFVHKGGSASSTISLFGLSAFDPSGGTGSATYEVGGTTTLTGDVPSGRTVTVDGGELVFAAARTNAGTIRLAGNGASTLGAAAHTLTNSGAIETGFGASRTVASPLANTGTIDIGAETLFDAAFSQTAGTTTVGSTLHVPSGAGLAGGVLAGSGTVEGDVQNTGGNVKPGSSPGILTVQGDYTQGAGGTLTAEIQGTADEDGHDQLNVTGTAALGGGLVVDSAGFTPADTNVFVVVNGGVARTGTFASVTGLDSAGGDKTYDVVYDDHGVELTVNPADADDDGWYDEVDCDDVDPERNPGAGETPGDGIDQDCDGVDPPLSTNPGGGDQPGGGSPGGGDQPGGGDPGGDQPTPPADTDGDGVPDSSDPEPGNPAVPGAFGATNGDNTLTGTAVTDLICGLLGNDTLNGLAGNDTLYGDACGRKARIGAAQSAADGNDKLNGGDGSDLLYGAGGRDSLKGGRGNDKLFGGAGNDSLNGEAGRDALDGGAGNDKLTGGPDANGYKGGSGDDTIAARNGRRETVDCGSGRKDLATVDRADKVRGCERVRRARK